MHLIEREVPSIATSDPSLYRVRRITTQSGFQALAAPWNAFLNTLGEHSLPAAHMFQSLWLQHFPPQRLWVLVMENAQGNWVGLAPFQIRRSPTGLFQRCLRRLQFIGTDPSVYDAMQIWIHPDASETAVLQCIANEIVQIQPLWDVIDLRYNPSHPQWQQLQTLLLPATFHQSISPSQGIPHLPLPRQLPQNNLCGTDKRLIKNLNNSRNHLKRDFPQEAFCLDICSPSQDTDAVLQSFFQRHQTYWAQQGVQSDLARYPKLASFYQSLLQETHAPDDDLHPRLQCSCLKVGQTVLSYHLDYWGTDKVTCHLAAYDPRYKKYRPGLLHMESLMRQAISQGISCFEFGRGEQDYKFHWAQETTALWDFLVLKNPMVALLWQADTLLKQLRSNLR